MNEFSSGFSATPEGGFSAVSMEELEQIEGGFGFLAGLGALAVGFCVGYTATSLILKAID
jgi:hypothetical protein